MADDDPLVFAPELPPASVADTRDIRRRRNPQHTGEWRPDADFEKVDGLKVTLRRERGLTRVDCLKVPLRLQVPPIGDFNREYGYEWSKFTTLRMGERSRPQGPTLMTLQIDTMLLDGPAQDDAGFPVAWPHAPAPQRIIRELRWIMGKGPKATPNPFQLTISQASVWPGEWLVNGIFKLTRVSATQKPGEVGTEYISLSFEEEDPLELGRKQRTRPEDTTRTHTHKPGADNLYRLAKRYYRAPSLWRAIGKKNGIAGVSPGSIPELDRWMKKHKKKKLTIPPKPKDTVTTEDGSRVGADFQDA